MAALTEGGGDQVAAAHHGWWYAEARLMRADGATLQECGDRFGVTRERVRQVTADIVPAGKTRSKNGGMRKNLRRGDYRRFFRAVATVARYQALDSEHGTRNAYARGCRCAECRRAAADASLVYRRKRGDVRRTRRSRYGGYFDDEAGQ